MSTLKGIIFDLDGTLVDSLGPTLEAFNLGIIACGKPRHTAEQIVAHFGLGEREILARIVGPENADRAYAVCRDYMVANMGLMPLHPGVLEVLDTLASRGLGASIVTGRGEESTLQILAHHGLSKRFVTVICHEHVARSKPAPEGITLALKRMGLQPHEACYVGDMVADMRAAHSAGTRKVAALWDALCAREEVLAHEPHHAFEKPLDLLTLLN